MRNSVRKAFRTFIPPVLLALSALQGPALASDATPAPTLSIELNAAEPVDDGCRLTFVVRNASPDTIEKAAFEFVLFDAGGMVDRMTVFDFKSAPAGRTRVRQFSLPGAGCDAISRVLINDVAECKGEGAASDLCGASLVTASRTQIEFGN